MSDMEEFERELSRRLRRIEPPRSLVETTLSRVAEERLRVMDAPQRNVWIDRLAALFLLTTTLLAGVGVTGIHHRRAAERAKAESDFARSQELIGRALEPVRQHLQRVGIALDE